MLTALAVLITWLTHEFAHWTAGEILGNTMVMTLNTSYPINSTYGQAWHQHVISAAGPLVTILEAIIVFFLIRKTGNQLLFPFLLTCLYMRTLAGGMNLINLNDEGRVSQALGLGAFTMPFIVFGILFYITFATIRDQRYHTKLVVITVLLIMVFSSVIILADQMARVVIISG
jgi:FtsH-binding integral membrane protein